MKSKCFDYTFWKWRFLGKTILQGNVATRLRCDGIVSNHLTTNFWQNPSVKEFRKSVKIRQSYHEKFDAPFLWDTVYLLFHGSSSSLMYINNQIFFAN